MIKYPEPLKKGDTIGIVAPSSGVTGVFANKLDFAKKQLEAIGYKTKEGVHVKKQKKLTSASAQERAAAFQEMYLDESVTAIIPPWGGEFLMDMLPHLNYEKLKNASAKWVMGFSDTSTLLFTLSTNINIATAHGPTLLDFGNNNIDPSVMNALEILSKTKDETIEQESLELYQKEWLQVTENEFPPYNLTEKVYWKILGNKETVKFTGRLIGGNLDVICKLIGTSFDQVDAFIERYQEDGILWYFESCEMNSTDLYRTLWQMKMNGWFKYCKGILMGRADGYDDIGDFLIEDAYEKAFDSLRVPVVYNIDLGHLPPQLVLINGSFAEVEVSDGKGKIIQQLI
jgi:muramoyltetrapeptide carboxypeptidase LdcA involved in peptidoglycan recycling